MGDNEMADVTTARKGALHAALAAIQTTKALFPQEEWGDEATEVERYLVEILTDIEDKINIVIIG